MRTAFLFPIAGALAASLFPQQRLFSQDYRPDRPPLEPVEAPAPKAADLPLHDPQDSLFLPDLPEIIGTAEQEAQARSEWDDILRTSADDAQRATDWRRRQTYTDGAPRDKERVGCICMDGFFSEATGRGACSTRGGVRFWVYTYVNGDTMNWPSYRHKAHPEPLNDAELRNLAAHNPDLQAGKQRKGRLWDLALLTVGSGAVIAALRLLLRRDTLHVIVHPPERKDE